MCLLSLPGDKTESLELATSIGKLFFALHSYFIVFIIVYFSLFVLFISYIPRDRLQLWWNEIHISFKMKRCCWNPSIFSRIWWKAKYSISPRPAFCFLLRDSHLPFRPLPPNTIVCENQNVLPPKPSRPQTWPPTKSDWNKPGGTMQKSEVNKRIFRCLDNPSIQSTSELGLDPGSNHLGHLGISFLTSSNYQLFRNIAY